MKQEELSLEEQVERIRKKRNRGANHDVVRKYLNIAYLILAGIGLVWYFSTDENRIPALCVVGAGMLLKVIELFIRFVL